jgi:hypothetical protein
MKNWPIPKFAYGAHVIIQPLDKNVPGRVVDLHFFGMIGTIEYDVRYFLDGKENKVRVFEDEIKEFDPERQ